MPEKQEHRTKIDQRVVIKDEATGMYPHARTYNEAFVRRQTHDSFGYPLVYVEWDKDHWAYSGEEDRWVLEAHFDPVEEKMADDKPSFMEALTKLMQEYNQPEQKAPEPEPDPRPTEELTYEDVLERAVAAALKAEAFIMLVASNEEFGGKKLIIPNIWMDSRSDEGALVLDAAAADYVAQSMGRIIHEYIRDRNGASGS